MNGLSYLQTMFASLSVSAYGMAMSSAPLSLEEEAFLKGYLELRGQLALTIGRGRIDVELDPIQLPLLRASLTGSLAYVQMYPADVADRPELQEVLSPERLQATLAQVEAWIAQPVPGSVQA